MNPNPEPSRRPHPEPIPFLDFKAQYQAIAAEADAAVREVLASGWYILGKQVSAFEEEFAAYLGAPHCRGVASGTDAIHLALRALGIGPGDEVIVPANTCVPTAAGVAASGALPVPADVDPETLTLCPRAAERAITPRTRALAPVHLYGHPCDMDPLLALAKAHGLLVVEDCAQAHGARYKGRMCGVLGDAAAFSFYPTKNLGACGDGGAVVTRHAEVNERVRKLRNYGEERRYHHDCEGFNSRLDEMQAAVLRVKLPRLDAWNAARRERARRYSAALEGAGVERPMEAPWAESVHHLYVIRTSKRDALAQHLAEQGIGTLMHYPVPLHLQGAHAHWGYGKGDFPQAEAAAGSVLSLPLYPELDLACVDRVAAAIRQFAAQ